MIVTLTANPALDRSLMLAAPLRHGEVQQVASGREDAGGKGINVARVVAGAGESTTAVLPLAQDDPFAAVLAGTGLPVHPVRISGHARANLTILDPDGTTTKLNLPGPRLDAGDVQALQDAVVVAAEGARWLVLAGSLPPGAGDDFYVRVISAVRARWQDAAPRIAVDTSGAALRAVVEHGRPDLIKPNDEELAELTGEGADPRDFAGIARVAGRLVPGRVGSALVTLGAAGALIVTPDDAWFGVAPRITPVSTVGAGDSSLAGFLLADVAGRPAPEALRHAMLYGAAAATLPGTQSPTPADLPSAEIPIQRISR
ncbi:1-phosphofructokinase family hexose kinase [Microbacterium caowuchunii]|jgi:1-phosphofructokinase|uniref:1-phosphofructokinase family hexose kinase n=1 Tax=Microbacterium caowuchunii TaxID=2614638 RepID=A0A5N0TIM3_9MICO|nr:1-phosphofructokinase family hexose kinase [Microbacterium caowuchunii]KAA9134940.1 1-phosphofructokinase family hexose kinase [Microbacterium caowuchunii]